jgi:hypothetical protein
MPLWVCRLVYNMLPPLMRIWRLWKPIEEVLDDYVRVGCVFRRWYDVVLSADSSTLISRGGICERSQQVFSPYKIASKPLGPYARCFALNFCGSFSRVGYGGRSVQSSSRADRQLDLGEALRRTYLVAQRMTCGSVIHRSLSSTLYMSVSITACASRVVSICPASGPGYRNCRTTRTVLVFGSR